VNKEFITPSGKTVVLKELTGGDFLDANASNTDADVPKQELSRRLINAAVASVGGVSEDIPNLLRALRI
jgi:hypothetical protein